MLGQISAVSQSHFATRKEGQTGASTASPQKPKKLSRKSKYYKITFIL